MANYSIMSLDNAGVKLAIYKVSNGKYKLIEDLTQPFKLGEEIIKDELISTKTKSQLLSAIKIYKRMSENYKCDKIFAVASQILQKARNYRGIIEEIYSLTGLSFSIQTNDELVKQLYQSVTASIDTSKGILININAYSVGIIRYNRRTVLSSSFIGYGSQSLMIDEKGNSRTFNEMKSIVLEEIRSKHIICDGDEVFLGSGSPFIAFGRITKKLARYPLDIDNNYDIPNSLAQKTIEFICGLDADRITKIKGIDDADAKTILATCAIISAVYEALRIPTLAVTTASWKEGLLTGQVLHSTQDKFGDLLGSSLDNYFEFERDEHANGENVYSMALLLFKQLKVMHKLPRFYTKPLRIAALMYDCGKKISIENYYKHGFEVILYSGMRGVTHRELLVASFICVCQDLDNFSLADYMRYKDILIEGDIEAVRKLGIIVRLADALNASRRQVITDVVCDILGDSVIMKTIVNGDATFEMIEGMKVAQAYKKVFRKSLQII